MKFLLGHNRKTTTAKKCNIDKPALTSKKRRLLRAISSAIPYNGNWTIANTMNGTVIDSNIKVEIIV